jgi:hypothetical protein
MQPFSTHTGKVISLDHVNLGAALVRGSTSAFIPMDMMQPASRTTINYSKTDESLDHKGF